MTSAGITALAVRSSLGSDIHEVCDQIAAGCRGLSYNHPFSAKSPMGLLAGHMPDQSMRQDQSPAQDSDARLKALFGGAIEELLGKSDVLSRVPAQDVGLIIGTTTFGYSQTAAHLADEHDAQQPLATLIRSIGGDALVSDLCKRFELGGFSTVIGSACTSAAMAVALAHSLVSSGQLKACLAGGFDVITPMTVAGFGCLQLLDHDYTRPFADDRAGINLGEGGAMFCIEAPDAEAPNAEAKAEPLAKGFGRILGSGSTCDAHDLTTPHPEATQIRRCIELAITKSGVKAEDIGLINSHGTGTPLNDAAESLALSKVFGESFAGNGGINFQATKANTGHLLGGAGALEAAIALASESADSRPRLSCSFGFGGSNVCLILEPAGGVS